MNRLVIIFLVVFLGLCEISFSQAFICGTVNDDIPNIKYFKPFKSFGNYEIPLFYNLQSTNVFKTSMGIDQPSFSKFIIGYNTIWLLVEPQDSVYFKINRIDSTRQTNQWLEVYGNNAKGHEYYNLIYNKKPLQKFEGLRLLFQKHHNDSLTLLIKYIDHEILSQTNWVDSLYNSKLISYKYSQYMKTEIKSILAWEIGNLCDNYYGVTLGGDFKNKGTQLKKELFKLVDPLDKKLYSCMLGHAYYDTYFEELFKLNKNSVDTSKVLFSDLAYIELAPHKIKEYNLGRAFFDNMKYAPEQYSLCEKFKKYKQMYPECNEYIYYLDSVNICFDKEKKINYKIIDNNATNFLTWS